MRGAWRVRIERLHCCYSYQWKCQCLPFLPQNYLSSCFLRESKRVVKYRNKRSWIIVKGFKNVWTSSLCLYFGQIPKQTNLLSVLAVLKTIAATVCKVDESKEGKEGNSRKWVSQLAWRKIQFEHGLITKKRLINLCQKFLFL